MCVIHRPHPRTYSFECVLVLFTSRVVPLNILRRLTLKLVFVICSALCRQQQPPPLRPHEATTGAILRVWVPDDPAVQAHHGVLPAARAHALDDVVTDRGRRDTDRHLHVT